MKDPKIIFREYCKQNNMRYTPERGFIIDEIYRIDGHFDADELFLRVRTRYPDTKLAKGSIYRTLPHLIAAGLLREALAEKGRIRYEHTLGHDRHDHLKCIGCGKILEFYDARIHQAQEKVCDQLGFKMLWHMHVVEGYCDACCGQGNVKNNEDI